MAKIKDICTINPKAITLADDMEVSFVPMPKVGEHGEFDPSEIKVYRDVKKGFTSFREGDVLFAKITPCMENGKGAIAKSLRNGFGFGSTEFHVLRPDYSKVSSEWLYYLTSWSEFRKEAESNMTGSAGQKRVPKSFLENYDVNLPELQKQSEITEILGRIGELIALRKEQLAKLDQMVKSRFIELFGERLEKETVKLSTLTEVITKGTTPTTLGFEFTESGVNFVKIECITEDGKFIVPKMLHISDECNQKLKRSILQEGDVLFSIAGAIGRTAIVTKEILPANTNQAVAIIRLRKDCGLNVKFLNQMLHSSLIEKQVNVKKAGVAQINLSLTDIGDFNIVVPPMEEQEQFATFVEQADKSKFDIQKSLEKLETLKKSLMQQYFG